MPSAAQAKQQAYEAAKAGLDATHAPQAAYDELAEAFFGTPPAPSPGGNWIARNPMLALTVLGMLGAAFVFVVIEGPRGIATALFGYKQEAAVASNAASTAAIAGANAAYADEVAKAERDSRVAQARYAEEVAKAERDQRVAEAAYALQTKKAEAERATADACYAKGKLKLLPLEGGAQIAQIGSNMVNMKTTADPSSRGNSAINTATAILDSIAKITAPGFIVDAKASPCGE